MPSHMLCSPARLFSRSRYTPVFSLGCGPLPRPLSPSAVLLFAQPCGKRAASGCWLISRLCCHRRISPAQSAVSVISKRVTRKSRCLSVQGCRNTQMYSKQYERRNKHAEIRRKRRTNSNFISHPAADSGFLRIPTTTTKVIVTARSTEITATTLPFGRLRRHFSQ